MIQSDPDISGWECQKRKQSYASAYDTVFKWELKKRLKDRQNRDRSQNQANDNPGNSKQAKTSVARDPDPFIRIFAAPLFRLVSANWARLVVRRSFDLDLLEWRSSNCLDSRTIEEIKSRRVALTRHQRDIGASLDILHALGFAEKGEKIEEHESLPGFNLGRPDVLIATKADTYSWWSIFWDFYELKASMDILEKRASKIHDGLIGMIQVVNVESSDASNKHAKNLNFAAFLFSIILLPFTIVPSIFSTLAGKGGPAITVHNFALAVGMATVAVTGLFLLLIFWLELYNTDELKRRKFFKILSTFLGYIPKRLERDPAQTLFDEAKKLEEEAKKREENGLRHGTHRGFCSELRHRGEKQPRLPNGESMA